MVSYVNEAQTIGITPQNVSNNKAQVGLKRMSIIITNTSLLGEKISLAIDQEAVLGAGITLYPGGSWEQTSNGGYLPPQARISAIASLATATISLYEEVY